MISYFMNRNHTLLAYNPGFTNFYYTLSPAHLFSRGKAIDAIIRKINLDFRSLYSNPAYQRRFVSLVRKLYSAFTLLY